MFWQTAPYCIGTLFSPFVHANPLENFCLNSIFCALMKYGENKTLSYFITSTERIVYLLWSLIYLCIILIKKSLDISISSIQFLFSELHLFSFSEKFSCYQWSNTHICSIPRQYKFICRINKIHRSLYIIQPIRSCETAY